MASVNFLPISASLIVCNKFANGSISPSPNCFNSSKPPPASNALPKLPNAKLELKGLTLLNALPTPDKAPLKRSPRPGLSVGSVSPSDISSSLVSPGGPNTAVDNIATVVAVFAAICLSMVLLDSF